jgi:hypothetical protein
MTVGVHARNAILVVFAGVMTVSLAEAEVDSSALPSSADAAESVAEPVIALDYLVIGEDAAAFFDVIARALSVRLDLSDKVHGTLSKTRLSGTSDKILDEAAQKLGLDWFTFNGVLYVSNRSEAVTRIVRLGGLKAGRVLAVLAENGLAVERLDIKPSADGAALALSGPPKLLALVETMIEGIAPVPVERLAESAAKIVTVRRGNEAEMVRLP